jgi:Aromatic acid exporter family member 2
MLGRSLFVLANFYSCMHTTIEVWIHEAESGTHSPPRILDDARNRLFAEEMSLLTALWTYHNFTVYEPPVGGKFPKATYDRIVSGVQTIVISMALMVQTTRGLNELSTQTEERWLRRLANVIKSADFNAHITTSVLCHLSAAVSNGSALPLYLSPPEPFPLAWKLRKLSHAGDGLLDMKNTEDSTYSAFASLEVSSSTMNSSLARLIQYVPGGKAIFAAL